MFVQATKQQFVGGRLRLNTEDNRRLIASQCLAPVWGSAGGAGRRKTEAEQCHERRSSLAVHLVWRRERLQVSYQASRVRELSTGGR